MRITFLFLAFFSLTTFVKSQDLLITKTGEVFIDTIQYNDYMGHYTFSDSLGNSHLWNSYKVKYYIPNYKSESKGRYLLNATRYYNTALIMSLSSFGLVIISAKKESKPVMFLAGLGGILSFSFNIAAIQQFKKAGRLMEIELAADRVGVKVKF
ncbi:MAG: hypothetical protein U9R19_13880 [Bacteroidota bacterium]|nr:hypothetical protein [Bacteroidota bacterium]